ncbi:Non-heme dioxygenase N-terminal domain-containing protein [Cynara cardunculus var. scolymus]|uniref:feruloyl-CoA 6-hydroxylase n=1 Tax=Cynara cardunculus var. scolymus TaxID=59895 RepID=A0A118JXM3_CYNCS|nr:Non-heme dioxygenase N-terminal domain-containing protein [Cynara cardunculus var. scolymus]
MASIVKLRLLNTCTCRRFTLFRQFQARYFSSILTPDSTTPLTSKEKSRAALSLLKTEKNPERIIEICRAASLTPESHLDRIAFSIAISKLADLKYFEGIRDFIEELLKTRPDLNNEKFIAHAIVYYGQAGLLDNAFQLFDKMPHLGVAQNAKSLNALLFSCMLAKKYDELERVYLEFPEKYGVTPNVDTYNTVIKSFCESGSSSSCYSVIDEMVRKKWKPNATTFGILISGFYKEEKLDEVGKVLEMMKKLEVPIGIGTYNTRIQSLSALMFCKQSMKKDWVPNFSTMKLLVEGLGNSLRVHEANELVQQMKESPQMTTIFTNEYSLFNFVVNDGNGVKGLVDSGLTEVPARYIQPLDQRINKQDAAVALQNMTVDLSELDGPNHEQVVKTIAHAAETLGFFQVVNHGVSLELMESLKVAAHRFFSQPAEKKAVYLKGVSPSPIVKYGTSFVPEKEKALEWKDYVSMVYTNDANALEFWPNECKLLRALIGNLEVKLDESTLDALVGLRMVNMNFYPTCPNPELTVGVGRHSDMGTLTVLLQDGIGGLYVKKGEASSSANEEWIEIPPVHGALVINVGDALQSAEHRVRTTSVESRVSVPIFNAPLPVAKIGPLPELVARDGVARYRELVFEDYMNNFFGKSHEGKKSLDFASIFSQMAPSFNDENSLFNFIVKEGNGIKGLVDSGLTEVPGLYIQPPDKRISKQDEATSLENMTIDLSELDGPNHDQVVQAIVHAAETLGFFQVANHGVPLELLESLKVAAHSFFGQPAKKKAVYLKGVNPSPMVEYGTSFAPEKEKSLEWKDYVSMMVVNMNYYPACLNPELTIGVGCHSDLGMLTVLLQDDIGGLYVKKGENEEWIQIPPVHGALVINIGDSLQIFSNGRYKSAEHRVLTTSVKSRVSVPLFISPLAVAKVGPAAELVARDGLARYKEIIFRDYMNNFFGEAHVGKKSLDFASI